MQVFCGGQQTLPCIGNGAFHGIKRAAVAGQHRVFQYTMQRLLQRARYVADRVVAIDFTPQLAYGHAVACQRAGLVHTQDGGGTQHFDSGDATREHVLSCQPPGA